MKVQVHPRYVEVQALNQFASELKNASPVTAESLSPQVKDINDRWNNVLKTMYDREVRHLAFRRTLPAGARVSILSQTIRIY